MEKQTHNYTVLFEHDALGGYTVTCPSLPGVVTEGETVDEALAMAQDAIRGYIESLQKDGLPIPKESYSFVSPVRVEIAAHA